MKRLIIFALIALFVSVSAGCTGKIDSKSSAQKASGSDLVAAYQKAKSEHDGEIYGITRTEINRRGHILDYFIQNNIDGVSCKRIRGCGAENAFAGMMPGAYVSSFNIKLLQEGAWDLIEEDGENAHITGKGLTKLKEIVRRVM